MKLNKRFAGRPGLASLSAGVPVLALTLGGLMIAPSAQASEPTGLAVDTAVQACQTDNRNPLAAEDLDVDVLSEDLVELVPGEVNVHLWRADVATPDGDRVHCTYGVVERPTPDRDLAYHVKTKLIVPVNGDADELGDADVKNVSSLFGSRGKGHKRDDVTTQVVVPGALTDPADLADDPRYQLQVQRTEHVQHTTPPGQAKKNKAKTNRGKAISAAAKAKNAKVKKAAAKRNNELRRANGKANSAKAKVKKNRGKGHAYGKAKAAQKRAEAAARKARQAANRTYSRDVAKANQVYRAQVAKANKAYHAATKVKVWESKVTTYASADGVLVLPISDLPIDPPTPGDEWPEF